MSEQHRASTSERRVKPPPTTSDDLLRELPARALLDRMPAPAIGLGHDGSLVYANESAATLLGFEDAATLVAQPLPSLLADHRPSSPQDCVAYLDGAGDAIVDWCHADDFPIRTTVSTLLLRASDPITMIFINDVTDLLWVEASQRRRA